MVYMKLPLAFNPWTPLGCALTAWAVVRFVRGSIVRTVPSDDPAKRTFDAQTRWVNIEIAVALRTRAPVCELMARRSCAAVHAKNMEPVVALLENAVIALGDLERGLLGHTCCSSECSCAPVEPLVHTALAPCSHSVTR